MGWGRGVFALIGCVAALAAAVAAARAAAPGVPWTDYLPALASPSQTHPNRVAHCKRAKLKCVRVEIRRMAALRKRLGCDHRAVFATTYLELTRTARDTLVAGPDLLRWPRWFFREDALFANVYFRSVRRWERGRGVPEAWQIAFETAEGAEVTGAQDMLLGINAHVQNDMPFVLARLGLRDRQGRARKPDHDRFNQVLAEGYDRVVGQVGLRYDATMAVTNPPGVPADDVAGLEVVRQWRENVWRNAERLVNATTDAERDAVAAEIQSYAAQWARAIASTPYPGARGTRDGYSANRRLSAAGPSARHANMCSCCRAIRRVR